MISGRRIVAVVQKEVRQFRRDRMTFAMILGIPVLQMLLFGYAINTDVRDLPLAVVDECRSPDSRRLVHELVHSRYFRVVQHLAGRDAADAALERGRISAVLYVPVGFTRELRAGRNASAQLILDAADPITVSSASEAMQGLQQQWNTRIEDRRSLTVTVEPRFNKELKTAIFVVPGLLGVVLTMTMTLLTGIAVARERERGNLEQIVVTPLGRLEFLIGKVIPSGVVGLLQALMILALGALLFGLPFRGNPALLLLYGIVFIAANLGVGVFFSTLARNQLQAMQMTFFFFLPSILLGGFMFPFQAMPAVAQWIGELFPLTHFLRLARGVILRGTPLAGQLPDLLALLAFTAVSLGTAVLRFQKRLG